MNTFFSGISVVPNWLWLSFSIAILLVEKSLSIDNLFIIFLIFSSFNIPSQLQHRVLFYGFLGAIVMRALFILLGAHLFNLFHWILYFFGLILVVTGIKLLFKSDNKTNPKENFCCLCFKYFCYFRRIHKYYNAFF